MLHSAALRWMGTNAMQCNATNEARGDLTDHAGEAMGAEEAWAAGLALERPVGDVLGVLQVDLLVGTCAARPAGLAPVDPRRPVAVHVGLHVVGLRRVVAAHQAVEVEPHLRRRADPLLEVPCFYIVVGHFFFHHTYIVFIICIYVIYIIHPHTHVRTLGLLHTIGEESGVL